MSDAWKPVYEKIKGTAVPEIKKEIGEIDTSGDTVSDIISVLECVADVTVVLGRYAADVRGLSAEDFRELVIHLGDDAIPAGMLEPFDDNLIGVGYDMILKLRKKEAA